MSMFGYMQVHCPICRTEFNGMRPYGREWPCCCKECHDEAEWRRTLAILKKPYYPDPRRYPGEEIATEGNAEIQESVGQAGQGSEKRSVGTQEA